MSALMSGRAVFHLRQAAFVTCWASIVIALAGIRGGKTHAGAFKTLYYAMEHPCENDEVHLVCSPTYPMSRVPREKLFKLLHDKSLFPVSPLIRYIKSERIFVLHAVNGRTTRIQLMSMNDPDKLRGIKALSAWLDEGAYMTAYAWEVVLGRLADSNGPCWITTTPDGYNFVFELYERAKKEHQDKVPLDKRTVRFFHWTSLDNTFIDRAGFKRLSTQLDSKAHAQEVEAKFVKQSGLVYHAYSALNNRKFKFDRSLPIYVGQDFNVMKMASIFCQPTKWNGLHAFHERLVDNTDTYALAQYLADWCATQNIPRSQLIVYPDASGKNRKTSGKTDIRILREAGFRCVPERRNPFIKDRINTVNGLLTSHKGLMPRLTLDVDACPHAHESLSKQVWDTAYTPAIPDKKHGFDHMPDAIGYVSWARHPLAAKASLGRAKGTDSGQKRKAA